MWDIGRIVLSGPIRPQRLSKLIIVSQCAAFFATQHEFLQVLLSARFSVPTVYGPHLSWRRVVRPPNQFVQLTAANAFKQPAAEFMQAADTIATA